MLTEPDISCANDMVKALLFTEIGVSASIRAHQLKVSFITQKDLRHYRAAAVLLVRCSILSFFNSLNKECLDGLFR